MNDNNRDEGVREQMRRDDDGDLRGSYVSTRAPVSVTGRVIGTVFIIAAICVAGAYVYETRAQHQPPKSVVADTRLPSPAPR